jgi:hypothetical protein
VDPALRCAAAEALGRIGDPAALTALTAGMASPAPEVRRTCATALSRLGAEGREWLGVLARGRGVAASDARDALESLRLLDEICTLGALGAATAPSVQISR